MIARNKFVKLNIKQKIYKIASVLRAMEKKLKAPQETAPVLEKHLPELALYLDCLAPEKDHPKIASAFAILENYLGKPGSWYPVSGDSVFGGTDNPSGLVKTVNLCFHELLVLIGEEVGEKFYDVRRFDSPLGVRRFPLAAILDNIRSPFNVGSIFRSADAFGVSGLALCGITPCPQSVKIERTAMGTIGTVNWKYHKETAGAVAEYRAKGWRVIAIETVEGAVPVREIGDFRETCFVFGNEEFGITDEILKLCDGIASIPVVGMKNSINVANSFAAVMYEASGYFIEKGF